MVLTLTPLFLPATIGTPELILIIVVIALLFGGDRVVKLARGAGKAMSEYQKTKQKAEKELEDIKEPIDEVKDIKESDRKSNN
ncbi:MAG: twin-arginine translocase TatA/TatE family subunit [Halobacteria archaeon]|nr:twin-arginine translocase TatA/TatE family subunit [Halobacteria archaeon]